MHFFVNLEKCRKYALLGGLPKLLENCIEGSSKFITISHRGEGTQNCNELESQPLCNNVINRWDPFPPIPYYVIYGRPLIGNTRTLKSKTIVKNMIPYRVMCSEKNGKMFWKTRSSQSRQNTSPWAPLDWVTQIDWIDGCIGLDWLTQWSVTFDKPAPK